MATKGKGKDKGKASTKGKGAEKAKDRRKGKKPAKDKALDATAKAAKAKAEKAGDAATMTSWTDALRIGPDFSLAALDAESTPGFSGDKAAGQLALGAAAARHAVLHHAPDGQQAGVDLGVLAPVAFVGAHHLGNASALGLRLRQ